MVKEWLAANKSWVAPLLFLAGAGSLIAAWHCHPVPERAISMVTFDAEYVGPLKGVLSSRGIGGGEIDLGYGIASARSYARFSKRLDVSEDDIRKIRAAGAPYQVGMLDRDIVTVSGGTRYRDLLLATAMVVLVLAIATSLARSTDTNGSFH